MLTSPPDVTRLLAEHAAGNATATEQLARVVYGELRVLASSALRRERRDHTWQPTELVHETFLRLTGSTQPTYTGRSHFFGIAARVMRQLLVEYARKRRRRPDITPVPIDDGIVEVAIDTGAGVLDLLALDDALHRLEAVDGRAARLVELRYFAGLSLEEAADVLEVSLATVKRDWTFARAFLRDLLHGEPLES